MTQWRLSCFPSLWSWQYGTYIWYQWIAKIMKKMKQNWQMEKKNSFNWKVKWRWDIHSQEAWTLYFCGGFFCLFFVVLFFSPKGLVIWVWLITYKNKKSVYRCWLQTAVDFRLLKLIRLRFDFGVLKVQKGISLFSVFNLSGFYTDNFLAYLLAVFLASIQLALQHAEW